MRTLPSRAVLAAAALVLSGTLAQAEDLTLVSTTTAAGKTRTSTTYMTAGKFKSSDTEHDSIIDTATGNLTMVEHAKKQYWEATPQDMADAMKAMDQMLEQQKAAMEKMPPAIREKMMAMTGGDGGDVTVTVAKGSTPRTVAGYPTDDYVVTLGTGPQAWKYEMWVAPGLVPPMNYGDLFRMQQSMATGPMMKKFAAMAEQMKQVKGFPLATDMTMMGVSVKTEVTEVKKGPVPPATFAVPAGYKKVDSPMKEMAAKMSHAGH